MRPSVRRRKLRLEAMLALVGAMLAVKFLPASRLTAWAARPLRHPSRFADPDWSVPIAAAVRHAAAGLRPKNACLPCALAAQFMLRRRGIGSRLCLGVRQSEGKLAAHAWIELGGQIVIGETDVPFTRLAEYGPAGAARRQS
jgi:hypothetical protein